MLFNLSGFNTKNIMAKLNQQLEQALKDTTAEIKKTVSNDTSFKGNRLKRSYTAKRIGKLSWVVGHRSKIAKYIEEGTRPHIIRPRYKKSLRFIKDGNVIFAKVVRHPGTRAYRPLSNAANKARSFLAQCIKRIKL